MKYSGNSGAISAITSTGTPAAVGEVKSFTLNINSDTIEASAIGDTWKASLAGLKSWDVSIECNYDPSDDAQADLVEGASVDMVMYPSGNTATREKFTGTGIVTSVSIPVESTSVVAYSVTVTGNGALTRGVVGA